MPRWVRVRVRVEVRVRVRVRVGVWVWLPFRQLASLPGALSAHHPSVRGSVAKWFSGSVVQLLRGEAMGSSG